MMRLLRNVMSGVAALSLVFVIGCDDNGGTDAGGGGGSDAGPGMVDSGGGGGTDSGMMMGTDSGMMMGTDSGMMGMCTSPAGPCDVTDPTSCGAGMACILQGSSATMWETVCIMAGAGEQGAACDPTMQGQCAEGFQCSSDGMICERICCDTTACAAGDFCGLVAGTGGVGFCSTPDGCDLLTQMGCAAGQGCYPSSGGLSCASAGTATEGMTCEFANSCAPGLGCIGPMGDAFCRDWCDMAATDACGAGFMCVGITGLPVGACVPM